jgi:hypothetical protein
MTAFNVVRFHVKPGRDKDFVGAHSAWSMMKPPKGARKFSLIKTGDGTYCAVGEWDKFESIVAARPMMVGSLDAMREMLEDMGTGVTDPVSGSVVFEVSVARAKPKAKKKAVKKAAKKTAKKSAAKKPAKKAKKAKKKKSRR